MKLGIDIHYAGARLALPIPLIQHAEAMGFDSVWASESYSSDAMTPLAYIAALTQKIRLGTGIAQLAARTPANLAMCAQTIDAMAGEGRMIVGLGVSGPQIVEGWYGRPWGNPAEQLRDCVAIMKKIFRREEKVSHRGKEFSLPYEGPGSCGLGKPLKSILHGNPDIPVLLGTSTPGNTRLCGEVGDGWLAMHVTPGTLPRYVGYLQEGLAKRQDGKRLADLELVASMGVTITSNLREAFDSIRPAIALYVGGMGAKTKNFHKNAMVEQGFAEAAERIQELFLAGHKAEAIAAVPDEYIDGECLAGPPERIRERFAAWRDSGFTTLRLLNPSEEAVTLMSRLAAS